MPRISVAIQLACSGQQNRQATDGLHFRIQVHERIAPTHLAWYRPLIRRCHARVECRALLIQPSGRYCPTHQHVAIPMQVFAVKHGPHHHHASSGMLLQ